MKSEYHLGIVLQKKKESSWLLVFLLQNMWQSAVRNDELNKWPWNIQSGKNKKQTDKDVYIYAEILTLSVTKLRIFECFQDFIDIFEGK